MKRHLAIVLVGVLAAAAGAAPAHAAEGETRADVAARDTIRGVVFDSLLHQPIPEATVQADAGTISTMTDQEGRFTLMSPFPIKRVTVFHDFLDRTGIGSLVKQVDATTSHSLLVLSTPSLATIWARVCPPGKAIEKARDGIVFGVARAADGRTRIEGATVRVTWDFDAGTSTGAAGRVADAKTDSLGNYYACGVPPNNNVYAFANSASLRSGSVNVPGDSLPLRRVDLVLGEFGKVAVVRGVVVDAHHQPLPGANIDVDGSTVTTRTDANGRFILAGVPTGSRSLIVRALGYTPTMWPVDVREKNPDDVEIDIVAQTMTAVRVSGQQKSSFLKLDYEQRKREGFGTFLDSTLIMSRTSIRSVFQGIPSVVITGVDQSAFALFTPQMSMSAAPGSGCRMNVYIDGQISDESVLISLSKEQIAAIEVYVRQETAPMRYVTVGNNCGITLVWTKLQFNKH